MKLSEIHRHTVSVEEETASIGTSDELAIALDVLNGRHDREVLEQLAPHLGEIVTDPSGLRSVLKSLSTEDQIFLIDSLAPQLAAIIGEASFLRDLFASLAHTEVELRIIEALSGEGLARLIGTAEELAEVTEWIYDECDEALLRALEPGYLGDLFKNAWELSLALTSLTPQAQEYLLDIVGSLTHYVRDGRDLAYLLRALSVERSREVIESLVPDDLRRLLGNRSDQRYLWRRLEPAEADLLQERLGVTEDAS